MRGLHFVLACTLLMGAVAGCDTDVDPAELPAALDAKGYQSWDPTPIIASGYIPAHGNSVRLIYVNPKARTYAHSGHYPEGSVIVKEVYHRKDDGSQGSLNYVAIMRKTATPPEGVPSAGGWIFTQADSSAAVVAGKTERSRDLCWDSCHRQGSWDGAWADYGD